MSRLFEIALCASTTAILVIGGVEVVGCSSFYDPPYTDNCSMFCDGSVAPDALELYLWVNGGRAPLNPGDTVTLQPATEGLAVILDIAVPRSGLWKFDARFVGDDGTIISKAAFQLITCSCNHNVGVLVVSPVQAYSGTLIVEATHADVGLLSAQVPISVVPPG